MFANFMSSFFFVSLLGTVISLLAPGEKMKKSIGFLCSLALITVVLTFFAGLGGMNIDFKYPETDDINTRSNEALEDVVAGVFAEQLGAYLADKCESADISCAAEVIIDGDMILLKKVTVSGISSDVCEELKLILPRQTEIKLLNGE